MGPADAGPTGHGSTRRRSTECGSTECGSTGRDSTGRDSTGRDIARLALPALGVLAAEPLYLLFDTAVVGRLGAEALAGLAVGGLILALVATQSTFLSYGTTARAARHFGAGDRATAVAEGAQATWLALALGALVLIGIEIMTPPLVAVIAGDPTVARHASVWLRVAVFGAPAILVSLAGNGWLRGVQDTVRPLRYVAGGFAVSAMLCPVLVHGWFGAPHLGLPGSAVANVVGQWLAAGLFLAALVGERVEFGFDAAVLAAQLAMGRELFLRSLAFQVCYISAAAVAARFGAASLAAHQVIMQLWSFLALVLDSLAIAAQALVGARLGAAEPARARSVAGRVIVSSVVVATALTAMLAAGASPIPGWFTTDAAVRQAMHAPWWLLVAQLPVAGAVFAVDGVLLGAGDVAFLRTATIVSALAGFLPLIWLSLVWHWGLTGIWAGMAVFTVLRAVFVGARAIRGKWAEVGPKSGGSTSVQV